MLLFSVGEKRTDDQLAVALEGCSRLFLVSAVTIERFWLKKFSPFADDFEQLSKTAESAVKLVRQSESQNSISSRKKNDQNSGSVAESVSLKPHQKNKPRKPRSWGKPVATFNTQIPDEMAGLLDDLVYRLRKSGKSKSKQELAREAIEDLLKKHKVL